MALFQYESLYLYIISPQQTMSETVSFANSIAQAMNGSNEQDAVSAQWLTDGRRGAVRMASCSEKCEGPSAVSCGLFSILFY
jgi:hypothetical protein